jgi:hypothetical protein
MKIKRILAVIWVVGLFILLFGGFFMLENGVNILKRAGFHISPVYSQSE